MSSIKNFFIRHFTPHAARKKIHFYTVYYLKNGEKIPSLGAFVASYLEAARAADRILYFYSLPHYTPWCESHGKDPGYGRPSWHEYQREVLPNIPSTITITINQLDTTVDQLASTLRQFSDYAPLFLPYEDILEWRGYLVRHWDNNIPIDQLTVLATTYDQQVQEVVKAISEMYNAKK